MDATMATVPIVSAVPLVAIIMTLVAAIVAIATVRWIVTLLIVGCRGPVAVVTTSVTVVTPMAGHGG
jgi:hypothetical protein